MQELKVAMLAMNSQPDLNKNWNSFKAALQEAVDQDCQWIVGPELFLGFGDASWNQQAFEFFKSEVLPYLTEFSAKHAVMIIPGSVPVPTGDSKFFNCAYVIDRQGHVLTTYNKRFMFQLDANQKNQIYDETILYEPGEGVVTFDLDGWRVGLAICYDLRFSSHFHAMIQQAGLFDVLLIPSAFTFQTGQAHWEVLLRSRAIEYQCFVVGVNQVGEHGGGKKSYGHSMAVDAWGRILLDSGETKLGCYPITLQKQSIIESRTRLGSAATLLRSLPSRS